MTFTSPALAPRIDHAEALDPCETALDGAPPPQPAARPRAVWPGLALTVAIAATGVALVRLPGLAAVSPMIVAMLIGITLRNTVGASAWAQPGIVFSVRRVLRLAIVLLGLQLTLVQLVAVGGRGLGIIAATLLASFAFATWAGRRLGVDRRLTQLIAAGTSICGASAVIATNTVTQAPDEDVTYAVACVTVFGALAMLIYPWLPALLGLDPQAYGLWAGASIHEVAQVVAAGFQDGQAAGEFATISKLARVMMMAPMVLLLGLLARLGPTAAEGAVARPPIPWFVLGFVAMIGLGSVVEIPTDWKHQLATLTAFLLSTALAAMGLDTDLRKLAGEGFRPALLGALATAFIAGFSLALIKLTG
jgi:uncharacterized integral membrane protein (TIGR00698 family)